MQGFRLQTSGKTLKNGIVRKPSSGNPEEWVGNFFTSTEALIFHLAEVALSHNTYTLSNPVMKKHFDQMVRTFFPPEFPGGIVLLLVLCTQGFSQNPASYYTNANRVTREYRSQLEELARSCEEQGLDDAAHTIRAAVPPRSEDKLYLPRLSSNVLESPGISENLSANQNPNANPKPNRDNSSSLVFRNRMNSPGTSPMKDSESKFQSNILKNPKSDLGENLSPADEKPLSESFSQGESSDSPFSSSKKADWEEKFWELRRTYAQQMYIFAKAAAKQERGALSIQMCFAAIHANPDHAAIRKILGFQKYKDQWRTKWEIDKLRKGYVDHERFGWIREKHVDRYEAGERYDGKKWITREEDAREHREIHRGWKIESEHYVILTNHSIEEGVRMSRKFEDLYRAWKMLFLRFMASDETLASLFDSRSPSRSYGSPSRHGVYVFRDEADYVDNLVKYEPRIEGTNGIYVLEAGRCLFYSSRAVDADDSDVILSPEEEEYADRTLLHEGTHQLFFEVRKTVSSPGEKCNYWILEGIATYMETLRAEGDYYVLGGVEDDRFQAAAIRLQEEEYHFFIPFEKLVLLGSNFKMFPMDKQPQLYSQCAGMTHFLMHANNGTFREPTLAYLKLVYEGKDAPETLEKLTSRSYEELNKLYREHIKANSLYESLIED